MKSKVQSLKVSMQFVPSLKGSVQELFPAKSFRCIIKDAGGKVFFEQTNVRAPEGWSQLAVDIAASKYFRKTGVPRTGNETSIFQLVQRVVKNITTSAKAQKYFASPKDLKIFSRELESILLSQRASFNSPVWFNCGLSDSYKIKSESHSYFYDSKKKKVVHLRDALKKPQVSACFIQSLEDNMDSIYELLKNEARLFKFGSGSGTNFSSLRSKYEKLSGGGSSSGVISFLEIFDRAAGSIKSGGTTRRAAKMVILDIDHPEIEDFIVWKYREEDKARALIREGYSSDFEGEAYRTVSGQNANNSVRVTNEFMKAVESNLPFVLKGRSDKAYRREVRARDLWKKIGEAAWGCADPGIQFHETINNWNPCPKSGEIVASNPCSEYMFLEDTACNLASLNLGKFLSEDGSFDYAAFTHTARVMFMAQDILVELASYPTAKIAENSVRFRPLGLGFAGLGSFLMRKGLPYDSVLGRAWASHLGALLQGVAVHTSQEIAHKKGSFPEYKKNQKEFWRVLGQHREALEQLPRTQDSEIENLRALARKVWEEIFARKAKLGIRNAQFTVMAPTGTIGLVMDADTTGIEPEFSLVKYKKLAGGGVQKIISQSLPQALKSLEYSEKLIQEITTELLKENSDQSEMEVLKSKLKPEHLQTFACANDIAPEGHVKMMAALQPFLSGAISKTVNLPKETSGEQILEIYQLAYRLGLKSIAIYRDGCKSSQPLNRKSDLQKPVDAPKCADCGGPTELVGGCFRCTNCGFTTGCIS
ncbi:MAG: vitamin B12-dependent ribonucleotide reductase [Pseudobdellovibrionaceae bacterium]